MATLSDSLVSSSARALPIRMRPDLTARRQHYLGKHYWVVKEPVGLNYFRFQEEEYAILQMLDGRTSLDEIKERFEAEFPPQKITVDELQQFLGMLHRSGLVIAGVGGQGRQLRKRRDERRRKEILGSLSNILCIRFKGIDPERFLNWLYPKVRWLFTPTVAVLCVLLCLAAGTLVVVEFDVFRSKLPAFYQFFNWQNGLLLAGTLGVIKIIHEFGHGLSCKHFEGECHEIGIMILVLTPCLYCNVSDSWMLPNKWHRALIGAAGIIVEIVIASMCTFLWWFSDDTTLLNKLCLNGMFVASVSTILFNGNPLLRYDGYYVLADVAEIPNLRQKATTILSRKAAHWFLGIEPPDDPFLPQRNQIFFVLYSIAAATYRWFILASIMWFLYQVFKPYGLEILGHAIIMMSMVGLVIMPLYKVGKFFYVPGRIEKVKKPRMYTSLAVLIVILLTIIFVPMPYSVLCPFEIQAQDAEPVYVTASGGGRLVEVNVKPGDHVEKGDVIARLVNHDLELEVVRLRGERRQNETQLISLRRGAYRDRVAQAEIHRVEEALKSIRKQLEDKEKDLARLVLKAPITGIVLPPDSVKRRDEIQGQLSFWSGTPFDLENLGGAYLKEENGKPVLFCQVGHPSVIEAVMVIEQADVEFVRELILEDQRPQVEIKVDALPHEVLLTEVVSVAEDKMQVTPARMTTKNGGEVPSIFDEQTGTDRPQSASYQASAPLGFFGHGQRYRWLRGRLEHSPDEETWRLRYVPEGSAVDELGGLVVLADASLLDGYGAGEFVELKGQLAEGTADAAAGNPTSLEAPLYEVTDVRRLDTANGLLQLGLRGQAKVHTQWMPLGTRFWRFVRHTFKFAI